jgi:hypothetical protein
MQYLNAGGDRMQIPRNELGMPPANLIVVRSYDHALALEIRCELRTPFAGSARIARGRKTFRSQPIRVRFALDHEYVSSLDHVAQPIGNVLDVLQVPYPTALTVRPPLREALRFITDHLVLQLALFVRVRVDGNNLPLSSVDNSR